MRQKRTVDDIFKLRILLYFLVPIVLMAVVVFANHQLNIQQYYKMYNEFYTDYANEVFSNMDKEINTISQMDYWLKNEDVKRVFESDVDISDAEFRTAIQHMNRMKSDFKVIDSILIVNRKADYVVATNGKASTEKYFNDMFMYKDYDDSYFKDIRYPSDATIKLPPTAIRGHDGITRYVMPVIRMASVGENPNSFFVFNISLDKLTETRTAPQYTSNTSVCFVNKKNKQIYSASGSVTVSPDEEMWDKIIEGERAHKYEDDKGNKYNVIARSVSPNLMDYAYLVFIPTKDVGRVVSAATVKIAVTSVFIYLLFVMIILFLASNVGKFFANLIKPLNFSEEMEIKEIFKVTDKISKEILKVLDENISMKLEMEDMISDVKEKMITDVINNKNRQVKMSLYKYDNFLPVIFRIIPVKKMSGSNLSAIEERLYSVMFKYFEGMYEIYDITNSNSGLHFVLNVPGSLKKNELEKEIKKLAGIISKNEIDVELIYHIGEMCNSITKLRDEYLKLTDSISGEEESGTGRQSLDNGYIYRVSESSSIINGILSGDYDKAMANIDQIIITNIVNNVSSDDMKTLYQSIINTLVTALKMKRIDVDKLIQGIDNDVYFKIGEKSEQDIVQFILDLFAAIDTGETESSEEKLMAEVMKYIDENYSDYALTLDTVANKFDVDAKNLSRYIKNYSNITFHKYITELRIEKAKRLLITTDMSIEQIYTEVGYVSRTTFMRAFNSVEKITPSEYRKRAKE